MKTFKNPDIDTEERVQSMVKSFYQKLLLNNEIKSVFEHVNFDQHMPNMVAFWSLILLDQEGYKSNVFEKHLHLKIKKEHFDIWISTFKSNIKSSYSGPKADLAIQRAELIAMTFESKLNAMGRLE